MSYGAHSKVINVPSAFFLNVTKAFDTISHNLLLDKLYNAGCRGLFFELLKSLLADSRKVVASDNVFSSMVPLRAWVSEGSILTPMLLIST